MRYASPFLLVVASLLLGSPAAKAQRVGRRTADLLVVAELQVEAALKGNDYLLATFNLLAQTRRSGRTFDPGYLRLGYEHFWNEHWSGGGTFRYVGRNYQGYADLPGLPGSLAPGVLLRHGSKIGPLSFGQRLGVEYAIPLNNLETTKSRALVRLRLDLDHSLALNDHLTLRPRLAYETAVFLRLQRDETELKERIIDFGSLRAELGLRLSPRFDLTPWVSSTTAYYRYYPFYDSNGKLISDGRSNTIIPAVGLDARLFLFPGSTPAEHQVLPSQH